VVGIVAAESEFPSGGSSHYDLYASTAYAAAFNQRVALLRTYYVRLAHGAADLAGFDSRFRSPDVYGTSDLDEAADAVQASIRPQVIGWYVLTGLAALAALAVIGQAMARQTAAERADQHALSALGVRPREFVLLALLRTLLTGAAGTVMAVLIAVLASPLTPVGEARLAVPSPRRMSLDLVVVLPGAGSAGRRDRGIGLARDTPGPAARQPPALAACAADGSGGPGRRPGSSARSRPDRHPARIRARTGRAAGGDGPARHGDGGGSAVRDRCLRGQPDASHFLTRAVRRAVPGLLLLRRDARIRGEGQRAGAEEPEA
jgi:hypothetical protein